MNELNYKNLSYISILFFVANFMLSLSGKEYLGGLYFVLLAVSMLLMDKYKDMMIGIKIMLILLMFLPVPLMSSIQGRIAVILVAVITLALMRKHEETMSRDRKLSLVQSLILFLFVMIFVGSLLSGMTFANMYMVPYAILYVIFACLYIRQMRDREFDFKRENTIKFVVSYTGMLAVMIAILCISAVRNFFTEILGRLFVFLGALFFMLIHNIYLFVYDILFKFSTSSNEKSKIIAKPKFPKITAKQDNMIVNIDIYYFIGIAVVVVILTIIVINLFKLQYKKEIKTANFDEKKECVKMQSRSRNQGRRYFQFKRGSFSDKIRYYYFKLMKDCSEQRININKCDTTNDINKKAVNSFKSDNLEEMRSIYLKARYTDIDCTKEEYEKFHMNYKEK